MIINIINVILVGVIFPIIGFLNTFGYDCSCITGNADEEYIKVERFRNIFTWGTKILKIPFIIIAIVISSGIKYIYNTASTLNCGDSYTNLFIKDIATIM